MKKAVSWMGIAAAVALVAGCAHHDQNNASNAGDDTARTASGQPVVREMPGSQGPVGDYSRTAENETSFGTNPNAESEASINDESSGAMASDSSIGSDDSAMGATSASDSGEGSATGSTTAAGGASGTAASEPAMEDAGETNDVATTTTTTKEHKAHAKKKKKAAKHKGAAATTEETTMNTEESTQPDLQTATAAPESDHSASGGLTAGSAAAGATAGAAAAKAKSESAAAPSVQPMATQKLMREVALNQIHHINQKEKALAKLAKDESESTAIKQAAEKMKADQERLEDRIEDVADKQDIDLKGFQPSTFEEAAMDGLDDLEGRDFDMAFVQVLRDDNRVATEQLEMLRTRISDPDIVALIDETLPTVKMHQQAANALSEINPSQDYSAEAK